MIIMFRQAIKVSIKNIALYLTIISLILPESTTSLAIDLSVGDQQLSGKTQGSNYVKFPLQSQTTNSRHPSDTRRPIWVLDHMVNSIKELEYRLEKGANAVETDITFGRDGEPLYNYHGPPCDCWRHCNQQEDFNTYLSYIREIAIDDQNGLGKNLTLLFLDLKLDYLELKSKARAGVRLAESIVGNLFLDSQASQKVLAREAAKLTEQTNSTVSTIIPEPKNLLRLVLSINHVADLELVNNFVHYLDENNSSHLMERIGFDVGMNDDIQLIEAMWKRFGNRLNIWQGDGYTNCFSPFYNLQRLSRALLKRDSVNGYPKKVYHWTIDLHDRMRESLKLGVDAIMTNHPERALAVLREPNVAHDSRLATRDDDPFRKVILRSSMKSGESARYQRSASPSSGGFLGNFMDVITSWWNFVKEIPLLSLPTTTQIFSRTKRHKSSPIVLSNHRSAPNQPEYLIDSTNGTSTEIDKTANLESDKPYDGPKWYTTLASSLIVSVMKIILPVQTPSLP